MQVPTYADDKTQSDFSWHVSEKRVLKGEKSGVYLFIYLFIYLLYTL
jgi:hypothetical protein